MPLCLHVSPRVAVKLNQLSKDFALIPKQNHALCKQPGFEVILRIVILEKAKSLGIIILLGRVAGLERAVIRITGHRKYQKVSNK